MPYRFRLWSGTDSENPVIDMLIRSPNKDHAAFVTKDLHMNYYANNYIPFGGMQNTFSKLDYVE